MSAHDVACRPGPLPWRPPTPTAPRELRGTTEMMKRIGAVLGGPILSGAGQPVRRGSQLKGTCEGTFWRRTSRPEAHEVVLVAKRYEVEGRQPGQRRGPLGHVALEVLELLANMVSHRTGRLDPSILTLMAKLKRSKDAVVRALKALREHGFLDWLRRHEVVELVEGPGPRVRQVSNAYRLSLPAKAAHLLGRWRSAKPPLPDDLAQAREDRAEWLRETKAALPLAELPLATVEDDRLARTLGELGRTIEERARAAREQGHGGEACS